MVVLGGARAATTRRQPLNRFTSRGDDPTRRLLALLAAPQPGAAEEVVRALSTLGTTDAIMPLLDLRRVSITDRRLVPAVDTALKAIRGTLQGVDGGRLAVVEGDPTRGGLSVADDDAGKASAMPTRSER